jgi:trehalose 6-phosphate phosphatase
VASWSDLRRAPERTGVFTDFDGTLSAIVDEAAAARPLAGAVDVLRGLAERYGRVAVISGRPASFLMERLELDGSPVEAYGLYGLEHLRDGTVTARVDALEWRDALDAYADAADAVAPDGVVVERKGLGVTLHVRTAPEHEMWARQFAQAEAAARGLSVHAARFSYELRPPVAVDKGTVVGGLVQGLDAATFLGDDRGDLAAFDALDRFAADGGTAVKVGVRSDEAPAELLERADVIADGPAGALDLLRQLL